MKKLDKADYYGKILKILDELRKDFPSIEFATHISTAFSEYGEIWGLNNKESLFALEKYKTQLELDSNSVVSDEYVDEIIKDGMNLTLDSKEEEEEDGY